MENSSHNTTNRRLWKRTPQFCVKKKKKVHSTSSHHKHSNQASKQGTKKRMVPIEAGNIYCHENLISPTMREIQWWVSVWRWPRRSWWGRRLQSIDQYSQEEIIGSYLHWKWHQTYQQWDRSRKGIFQQNGPCKWLYPIFSLLTLPSWSAPELKQVVIVDLLREIMSLLSPKGWPLHCSQNPV